MILSDLISAPINCAKEAANDFHWHFDNRADGIENEVRYIVIERPSNLAGFLCEFGFYQVDSNLRNCIRECLW